VRGNVLPAVRGHSRSSVVIAVDVVVIDRILEIVDFST
jgi:hypothetical protein